MALRPYQQAAVDAAISWMTKSTMPACLELATGSGKSHIVASLAHWIYQTSGKKVLCLQPSKELTEQNAEKYIQSGYSASIFSASAGSKCMRHSVVYGTPGTVKNSINRFGDAFAAVIVDEAHGMTPTIKTIIKEIKDKNKYLRVIGLSATPYTMTKGFIYQYDVDGRFIEEDQSIEPYFNTLLYRVTTEELIDMGYLTPAHSDPSTVDHYNAKSIQINSRGKFDQKEIDRVFVGKGRLTSKIIEDVVNHSSGRMGVMIFAASVEHAKECMESLPKENSRMLGGDINMKKSEREKLIKDFKSMQFKYIVSVGTLTTGFDAPHVDVIAVLRATESPGLFQQIIGRGLRLHDYKTDCLVLDYAENIERHDVQDNLFKPKVKARKKSESIAIKINCPSCNYENEFTGRPNPDRFEISQDGYFIDLSGKPIETDSGPMPAHFGRRCQGQVKSILEPGVYERCEQRWTSKECPSCEHLNDIAARFCEACKFEIVNPNDKLKEEFIRIKKDPYEVSTDAVIEWSARKSISRAGNEVVVCDYKTKYRKFTMWFNPESNLTNAQAAWVSLSQAVYRGHIAPSVDVFMQHLDKGVKPETVTYCKQRNSQFYRVFAHNRPEEKMPE